LNPTALPSEGEFIAGHMDHEITECPECHAEKYLGSDFVKVTWTELKKNPVTGVTHELLMRN